MSIAETYSTTLIHTTSEEIITTKTCCTNRAYGQMISMWLFLSQCSHKESSSLSAGVGSVHHHPSIARPISSICCASAAHCPLVCIHHLYPSLGYSGDYCQNVGHNLSHFHCGHSRVDIAALSQLTKKLLKVADLERSCAGSSAGDLSTHRKVPDLAIKGHRLKQNKPNKKTTPPPPTTQTKTKKHHQNLKSLNTWAQNWNQVVYLIEL